MNTKPSKSGIKHLGTMNWGAHACLIHESEDELLEVLIPWFREGLAKKELCVWITRTPASDALDALKKAAPELASHIEKNAFVVKPFEDIFLENGAFSSRKALAGLARLIEDGSSAGFQGIRVAQDACRSGKGSLSEFIEYELEAGRLLSGRRALAICSYPARGLTPAEAAEAASVHDAAIVKKDGSWAVIRQSGTLGRADGAGQKYRGLYEAIRDGVMKVWMDGRITDSNRALEVMLGRSAGELQSLSYSDITPSELRRAEEEILKGRLIKEGFCECEKEFLKKDGTRMPASVNAWLVKDPEGMPEGFWLLVKDLTEAREAEKKLLDRENLFNALTLSLPGIFYIVDKDGKILKWNRALEETTEYSRLEIEKMHPVDFFDASEKPVILGKMEQAFALGAAEVEAGLVTKDGRSIPFHFRAVKTTIGGQPCLIGTGTDISRWKTAETGLRRAHSELEARIQERTGAIAEMNRRLKNSEERLRVLIETTSDWVWEVDSRTVYTYVSPKVRELLGYEPGELLGRTPFDLMAPAEAERVKAEFGKIAALKKPFAMLENTNIHKDGHEVVLETSGAPILDPAGNLLGWRGIDRDITVRKRQEAEQAKTQSRLAEAQKMEATATLARGVAHEFNNLMVIIRLNNSMAMKKAGSAEIKSYLGQIETASERAENLTRGLLIFSRSKPGETVLLDLNRKITDTLRSLRRLLSEEVIISTSLSPGIGLIRGHGADIEQLVMNLAMNAKDAMAEGGKITIRTEKVDVGGAGRSMASGSHVKLTVEDTGSGMDGNVIKNIFEPFFSTKGARATGLGLAVVHNIIKDAGGWIDVESRPGKGTRFDLFFPSAGEPEGKEAPDEKPSEELMGSGEKVLLVEDETLLRKSMAQALAKNGYRVLEAGCAKDARAVFEKEDGLVDLVFTDIILQDGNGVDLVRDLNALNGNFKVLIMSGYLEVESSFPSIRENGYRFLQKPFEMPELLRAVATALGRSV